jgi:hypothetical protein
VFFAEFERTMIRQRSMSQVTVGAGRYHRCGSALLCGAATLFRDREHDVTAQSVVGDSKNIITLARSSADVSPP